MPSNPIIEFMTCFHEFFHQYFTVEKEWYFVIKIVLTYCEKKIVLVIEKKLLKFEAEGQKFLKCLSLQEQFIRPVKVQTNFCNRMLF